FARLEGAYLTDARLESAMLLGASLNGATLNNARLAGANLSNTQLAGAELFGAHLEGAQLCEAALGGKTLTREEVERTRRWLPDFPEALPGARLGGVFFDNATDLDAAVLGDETCGCVAVADARWGGVNLAVLDWAPVKTLGDEREAWQATEHGGKPKEKDEETRLLEFRAAVRANRQLVVALRDQGLSEEADRFAYRAQRLQREVLRRQALRREGEALPTFGQRAQKLGAYAFSHFLDVLAGYGYKPGRSLLAYLLVLGSFTALYFKLGGAVHPPLSPLAALIFSVTSFHGRGFFPGGVALDNPLTVLAAGEAILGLIIEISFIATFTQRFFGK
ncbi:MAG TPA: pentapeptide repeat-containing protein, partial [Ktedonobacterales bacterium]|nr:pentapeptide repeat-containing protein [Ktedonobacterales bacterium]